jgi:hypothetical protein
MPALSSSYAGGLRCPLKHAYSLTFWLTAGIVASEYLRKHGSDKQVCAT